MTKPTKQQLEAVSRLIQACHLCGAKYHETFIEMPDGLRHEIRELGGRWSLSYVVDPTCTVSRNFPKIFDTKKIQITLLQHHLDILQILL